MTLDEAVGQFDTAPSDKICAKLLRTAVQYHEDGVIFDFTLHNYVERVAEWLEDK